MYYVYALHDPRTETPFYIGKGKKLRCLDHLTGNDLNNIRKVAKIAELREAGVEPGIRFICVEISDEAFAYELEMHCIQELHKLGFPLTNRVGIDLRPPSRKGIKWTVEAIQKRTASYRANKTGPKVMSEAHCRHISEALKGIPRPKSRATCIHCRTEAAVGLLKRWHFANCKSKA
jgi:hypothetical protein